MQTRFDNKNENDCKMVATRQKHAAVGALVKAMVRAGIMILILNYLKKQVLCG